MTDHQTESDCEWGGWCQTTFSIGASLVPASLKAQLPNNSGSRIRTVITSREVAEGTLTREIAGAFPLLQEEGQRAGGMVRQAPTSLWSSCLTRLPLARGHGAHEQAPAWSSEVAPHPQNDSTQGQEPSDMNLFVNPGLERALLILRQINKQQKHTPGL